MNTPIDEFFKTAELSDTALSNYFGKMPRYRGRFFVQMKALMARNLERKATRLKGFRGYSSQILTDTTRLSTTLEATEILPRLTRLKRTISNGFVRESIQRRNK
jgi:hypothetical protein